MRVLVVSNMYPSEENPGYGVFVRNFECSLRAQGVDVDRSVIYGRGKNKLDKIVKYFYFGFSTVWRGLSGRYDCIYVHYLAHSMLPIFFLLKLKRVPLICNAHGEDLLPATKLEKLIFFLVKRTVARSKLIVVPSDYFADIAQHRFPHSKVFVSPSAGVDLDIFRPSFLGAVFSQSRSLHLGFVSRIDAGKGWDVLLYAASKLRQVHPEIKFRITLVGEGAQVSELISLISQLKLGQVVSYQGALPQSMLPEYYSSLDAFVFPTVRAAESLGLVGLEALACGVPAICSNIGGIRGYMSDGVNGYVFTPGDADALAQKIVDFSRLTPAEVGSFSEAAVATAQRYGRDQVSSDLYLKLIEVVGC